MRRFQLILILAMAGQCVPTQTLAQTLAQTPTQIPAATAAPAAPVDDALDKTQTQLRGVQDTLDASAAQRRKIEAEVESLRADRARLTAALLDTGAKVRAAQTRQNEDESKLAGLTVKENTLRQTLDSRREVLAQVLAALQRIGRKPPPAVLVRPEDMLAAIHTSILLGAVLPQMAQQAQALADDLKKLVDLRNSIASERDNLSKDVASLNLESAHLDALVKARQAAQNESEAALAAEQKRSTQLAAQARNLQDLIQKMEKNIDAARIASDKARKSDELLKDPAAREAEKVTKLANNASANTERLAPAVSFVSTKGSLDLPVSGQLTKNFGDNNGFGGTEKGVSVATAPNSTVFSPVDSWVLYAGPYRTYGQLIILNAGEGYYIVMAGMQQTDVRVGQFVLAGEPVGKMGGELVHTAASLAIGANVPILYIEFRKDGSAIDPGPWWAKSTLQKVRG